MSELITTNTNQNDLRWQLLTTVCAASLLAVLSGPDGAAMAQESDRPTVWIELGGQLEGLQGKEDDHVPPFIAKNMDAPFNAEPLTNRQRPPRNAFGGEGKISFRPEESDWVFSAALRFGRSNGKGKLHQQTSTQFTGKTFKYSVNHGIATKTVTRFNDTRVKYHTTHTITARRKKAAAKKAPARKKKAAAKRAPARRR